MKQNSNHDIDMYFFHQENRECKICVHHWEGLLDIKSRNVYMYSTFFTKSIVLKTSFQSFDQPFLF